MRNVGVAVAGASVVVGDIEAHLRVDAVAEVTVHVGVQQRNPCPLVTDYTFRYSCVGFRGGSVQMRGEFTGGDEVGVRL